MLAPATALALSCLPSRLILQVQLSHSRVWVLGAMGVEGDGDLEVRGLEVWVLQQGFRAGLIYSGFRAQSLGVVRN